jgi:hypothetical protein
MQPLIPNVDVVGIDGGEVSSHREPSIHTISAFSTLSSPSRFRMALCSLEDEFLADELPAQGRL